MSFVLKETVSISYFKSFICKEIVLKDKKVLVIVANE